VTEDLSRHYPEAARGAFNIGLLHTSVDGREGHDRYAPCAIASLENRNYDYWALGHVHQREQLSPEPAIHFPGNIQGRHILENGEKGVLLVSVDASQRVTVDFRCLDVFRWAQCPIDVTGASGWSEALAAAEKALSKCISAAGDIPLAVRFLATGRTSLHETLLAQRTQWIADLRALANDIGNGQVWVEKTLISTSESEGALPPVAEGPLATLNQVLLDLESGAASLAPFDEAIDALRTKLPAELREGRELEALLSGERGASLVGDIRALLFGRLQSKEAE
jgi:DNA repair exonuclease SbcCD nuclease subunit